MSELLVEWTLTGMRDAKTGRFMSSWAGGSDLRTAAGGAFLTELGLVTEGYRERVAELFAAKHGDTGETADSMRSVLGDVTSIDLQYKLEVGGNVGFVINPLPNHPETGYMGNDMGGPFAGREANFYSAFGPRGQVEWFQGGPESYSPDISWYTDAQAELDFEGAKMLQKISVMAKEEWALGGGGPSVLMVGSATLEAP